MLEKNLAQTGNEDLRYEIQHGLLHSSELTFCAENPRLYHVKSIALVSASGETMVMVIMGVLSAFY